MSVRARSIVIIPPYQLVFTKCILKNEIGNVMKLAYVFGDPDGVHSGKSGYSFGVSQFDIHMNPNTLDILLECGFTTEEIRSLKDQTADVVAMALLNAKLFDHKDVVDKWDAKQIKYCMSWVLSLMQEVDCIVDSIYPLYHIADYHNQLNMSRGGRLYTWLKSQSVPVTSTMIRDFKLTIDWGLKRPDDVKRRYKNIVRISGEEVAN
jgi:hypothetical protein